MTDSGYTKINLAAGDVFSEAACDALDNQIDELSRRFWRVDDQTWVTQNAVYTGTVWNREDIAKPAAAIRVDGSGNQIDILTADAGANPITWADGTLHADQIYGRQIYTSYTVAASANPLVTFPDKAVAAAEGLVRIVHFVVGPACVGSANTLRVSGYVTSGGGYIGAIRVDHNSVAVLDDSSIANETFTVDL
ncbi:MAG: hypothetical protein PHX88_12560, partial [Methanoculleus horonobensis]|nr:hypothetical protein [Methanoculleus horonobensis]